MYGYATLAPGGHWEINVKHSWRNPPKNFIKQLGSFCPKTVTMAEDPKASAVGEKSKHMRDLPQGAVPEDQRRLGDKCTEEKLGEPSTKPFSKRRPVHKCKEKVGGAFHKTFFEEKTGRQM